MASGVNVRSIPLAGLPCKIRHSSCGSSCAVILLVGALLMLDAQVAGGADATVGLLVAQSSPPFRILAPSFLPSFFPSFLPFVISTWRQMAQYSLR